MYLLGLLFVALLIALPVSEAIVQIPGRPMSGIVTKNQPFKYLDQKVNPGEMYVIYFIRMTTINNKLFADLEIKVYDKNGMLRAWIPWRVRPSFGFVFNGGQGPRFTVEKIQPARCLPRTNKCSEDAVLISAT